MDVIYLGLSCGFAVSPDSSIAAIGTPDTTGWTWTAAPEIAADVRKLADIKNNQLPPQLITLPLTGRRREAHK
jgi:hypothetical protein